MHMLNQDDHIQVPSGHVIYPSTMVINSSEGPEPPGNYDQGLYDKYFDESLERSPKIPMGLQILNHNNFKNNHLDDS